MVPKEPAGGLEGETIIFTCEVFRAGYAVSRQRGQSMTVNHTLIFLSLHSSKFLSCSPSPHPCLAVLQSCLCALLTGWLNKCPGPAKSWSVGYCLLWLKQGLQWDLPARRLVPQQMEKPGQALPIEEAAVSETGCAGPTVQLGAWPAEPVCSWSF